MATDIPAGDTAVFRLQNGNVIHVQVSEGGSTARVCLFDRQGAWAPMSVHPESWSIIHVGATLE